MERAPARFGPSVSALLRGFSRDPVTVAFSSPGYWGTSLALEFQKIGAIILVLMMAPKLSGDAVLGDHHLYGTPRTMTGVIRTTRISVPRRNSRETGRSFEI